MTKEKIAFVVVRYGKDINGGAEYHCRMLAERLVNDYDIQHPRLYIFHKELIQKHSFP